MAGYNEIRGLRVKYLSADPAGAEEGQVWYNSTTGNLRVEGIGVGAWSSGTNLPVATFQAGAAGVQTASLMFGGTSPPSQPQKTALTFEYNGSGWSPGGSLNTPRTAISGAGTQTAALGAGGYKFPGGAAEAEEYNGSAWTNVTSMPAANSYSSSGPQTAALYNSNSTTLEYDGTSWSPGGSLNTPRNEGSTAGTVPAGLFFGGGPQSSGSDKTEEYNGTSWTQVNTMNTQRGVQIGGSGIQTSALAFGGSAGPEPAVSAATESYDGTTWTTQGNLATANRNMAKGGSTSADSTTGISMGGLTNPITSATEEYNFGSTTVTAAAWASGGSMNAVGGQGAGTGIQTAAIVAGGQSTPTPVNTSESYDGTSWTNLPTLGTARTALAGAGTAPNTASLMFGGYLGPPYPNMSNATEEYNGSSWSEQNNLSAARYAIYGFGTQTAAVAAGGDVNPLTTAVEEYDGTNWTAGGSLGTAKYTGGASGTLTAGLIFGGRLPAVTNATEEYDGSSWTTGGNLNAAVGNNRGAGTQTSTLSFGGQLPADTANTEAYDGTSWSTRPSMSTARNNAQSAGASSSSALNTGGYSTAFQSITEEFTGETVTVNPARNLSTS